MVEQIQPTPPYEVLTSLNVTAGDSAKTATSSLHAGTHTAATTAGGKGDTVTLSESAQASQLYLEGNSVSQIAALLGLPPATINRDLNLSPDNTLTTTQKAQEASAVSATASAQQGSPATSTSPFNTGSSPVTAATLSNANVS